MGLREIGGNWYVYFRDVDGKLKTRSLKTKDRKTAIRLERDYMDQVRARKGAAVLLRDFPELKPYAPAPVKAKEGVHQRGGIRLADMLECAETKRPISKDHRLAWKRFTKWTTVKYADQVTPRMAQDYLMEKYSGGNGKAFNNNRTMLNTIFRCCLVEAGITASPFASVINRRVLEVETHRNFTPEEFDRIIAAAPLHLKVLAMLSRWTCQRLETCASILPEMFDFDRLVFVIEPGKTRRFKKWVCVPIMPELEAFIRPLLPDCKPGVPIVNNYITGKFKSFDNQNSKLSMYFRRLVISLGIKDTEAGKASFHSIRGTAITWFKEQGIRGEELRSITGHESSDVEDVYARDIATLSRIAKNARKNSEKSM